MAKIYGQIETTSQLRDLQEKANKENGVAVGISHNRVAYAFINNKATRITANEVAKYLDIDVEKANELIEARGNLVLEEPKVEEPKGEEVNTPIVEASIAPTVEEKSKEISDVIKTEPEIKINAILEDVANKIAENHNEDNAELVNALNDLTKELKEIKELLYERLF